jgi:hypothetical protein
MSAPAKAPSPTQRSIDTLVALVKGADTQEAALDAVKAHCDAKLKAREFKVNGIRKQMTLANMKLMEDGDKLAGHCRYPALQYEGNNAQDAKRAAVRESTDGALLQIDLDVELYPLCLEILKLHKAKASHVGKMCLTLPMVAVAFLFMTGRRLGGVVDDREGAPVWEFSNDDDEYSATATMSFLLKQGEQKTSHTFPVLCDIELLDCALTDIRDYCRPLIKSDAAPGVDALKRIGGQLNTAVKKLFPAVDEAWDNFFEPREREKKFTVHALRAFYGAKLWSIYGKPGGIYLAQLKIWLGHSVEDSSKYYEKVVHVKGHVLDSVAAAAPVTEEALINNMLTSLNDPQQPMKEDRKRKLRTCLAGMIVEIGKEEEKAARAAAKESAAVARAAKKQKCQ